MPHAGQGNLRTLRRRFVILAAVYYVVISVLSQIPGEDLDALGFDIWDKLAHLAAFAPLGLLILLAMAVEPSRSARVGRWLLAASSAVLALGALDEIHQVFVPGRRSDVLDALADGVGGAVGSGVACLILRTRSLIRLFLGLEPLDELEAEEQEEPVVVLARDPVHLRDGRHGE